MRDQGITFSFFNNPVEGDRISVSAFINSIPLVYNNGFNVIDFEFTLNDSEISADPLHRVKIGSNTQESRDNLKLFFQVNGYQSSSVPITYAPDSQTIESLVMHFQTTDTIGFVDNVINSNVAITFFDYDIPNTINLKYFFIYKNVVGDLYRCDILQKGFAGSPLEIHGKAVLTKGEAKDHLDIIRGSGLSIKLEANKDLTFEDLYFGYETDFQVRFYRNEKIEFMGFLKPDGIVQSYTRDLWEINIDCVDGLGFLNDISFTRLNGLQFTGKMSHLDIIYNCLNKTGLSLPINTYVDIEFEGMIDTGLSTNVLSQAFLSVERFVKSDDNTIMSCAEVLSSILGIYSAVVTQINAQWYIYRSIDFFINRNPKSKRYNLSNDFTGIFDMLPKTNVGSQINNYYPHHCNGNQQITIKGAISAFRLGYKYGFIGSILGNGNLKHEPGTKIYENWNVDTWTESKNSGSLVIDPISDLGISFKSAVADIGETRDRQNALMSAESDELLAGYSVEFKTRFKSYGFPVTIEFYVYLFPSDGSASYTLNADGSWNTPNQLTIPVRSADVTPNSTGELVPDNFERTFSISSAPLPKDGTILVGMFVPFKSFGSPAVLVEVKSIEIFNTFSGNNVVGEFHTVSRSVAVSSIVKENKSVSIGDNNNTVYAGAIYKGNTTNLTSLWKRKNISELKPILRIAAEDNLRISQRPVRLFNGDMYGFCNYISLYTINKISGVYLPVSWSFDTYSNIAKLSLLELNSPELNSIDYIKTDDYGETVKPTIVS